MEDHNVLSNHHHLEDAKQYEQNPYQVVQTQGVQHVTMPLQQHSHHLHTLTESEAHHINQMMHQPYDYRQIANLHNQLNEHVNGVQMQGMDGSDPSVQYGNIEHITQLPIHNNAGQGQDMDNPLNIAAAAAAKKRRHDKEMQMNVCLALGCDRQIKQRRLCPMHQKQKERNGGKLELKENTRFAKGRTPTPFSRHANKYAKLKSFDKKIDEWAGGREEGTMMLESYLESSYHQSRFSRGDDSKIYEAIGRNIVEFMKQLPEKSPLRRPLIKAMSENVPLSRLREVLPVSKQTVINSKKLNDEDNLLLTIRYKPSMGRLAGPQSRKRGDPIEIPPTDDSIVSLMGAEDISYSHQLGMNHNNNNNSLNLNSLSINTSNSLPSYANITMSQSLGHHEMVGISSPSDSLRDIEK